MHYKNVSIVNDKIKEIIGLYDSNQFDEALRLLKTLPNFTESKPRKIVFYLKRLIKEKKYYRDIQNSELGDAISNYLKLGKEAFNTSNYEEAIEHFKKGLKETGDILFTYYMGVCFYKICKYDLAITYLLKYKEKGTIELENCNKYLSNIYQSLAEKHSKTSITNEKVTRYYDKIDSCLAENELINEIRTKDLYIPVKPKDTKLSTDDKEINELIKNGKINDVISVFETAEYERKVTILAMLYINGFEVSADKLLKKERQNLKSNCPDQLSLLNKNKKLYLAKAKRR